MPDDAGGTPFTQQLMSENRISEDTANAAVTEYKKFMYLCATRPERNVPSKAVDLVWHLHMQHSRDYWDGFCKKLGKPVHHNPGGQGAQHLEDYRATVDAYTGLFGTPPKGIWRRENRVGHVFALIISAIFMILGGSALAVGADVVPGMIWMSISLSVFVLSLIGLTSNGEFALIFECDDPFSDRDAGDCGSGDGGGCGD